MKVANVTAQIGADEYVVSFYQNQQAVSVIVKRTNIFEYLQANGFTHANFGAGRLVKVF